MGSLETYQGHGRKNERKQAGGDLQVALQNMIRMEGNLAQQGCRQKDEQEPNQMQQDRLDLSAIGYQ